MTQPNCHQPSPCQLKTYIERYHERYDNERLLDKDVTYLCQSRRRAMKLNEDIVAAQDAATLVELPYGSIQPPSSTTRADTVLLLCSPYKVRLITAHAHSSPGYASQSTLFTLTFGPDIRWMGTLEVWPLTCWGKLGMAFALGRHLVLTFPLSPFPPFVLAYIGILATNKVWNRCKPPAPRAPTRAGRAGRRTAVSPFRSTRWDGPSCRATSTAMPAQCRLKLTVASSTLRVLRVPRQFLLVPQSCCAPTTWT